VLSTGQCVNLFPTLSCKKKLNLLWKILYCFERPSLQVPLSIFRPYAWPDDIGGFGIAFLFGCGKRMGWYWRYSGRALQDAEGDRMLARLNK
jgi:hypothetical protein